MFNHFVICHFRKATSIIIIIIIKAANILVFFIHRFCAKKLIKKFKISTKKQNLFNSRTKMVNKTELNGTDCCRKSIVLDYIFVFDFMRWNNATC